MEENPITIKTEVEDSVENGDRNMKTILSKVHESNVREQNNSLINVKLESDLKSEDENDEFLFTNKCKHEIDAEIYDEFYNEDARAIYLNESKSNIIQEGVTSELGSGIDSAIQTEDSSIKKSPYKIDESDDSSKYESNARQHQIKHEAEHQVKSIIRDLQLQSGKDQVLRNENKDYMVENKFNIADNTGKKDSDYENLLRQREQMAKKESHANQYKKHLEVELIQILKTKIKQNLQKHQYIHLKCNKCDRVTKNITLHQQHQKRYTCDKCDISKKRKVNLKKHQTLKHSEAEPAPFKCKECPYQTKITSLFKKHQLVHTEERPFKCSKCNYSGKSKARLTQHQKKHSEVKKFKCDKCPYQTINKFLLQQHQLVHTEERPFRCDVIKCHYSAKTKALLKQHQLKHSKVKTFKCAKCSYQTKTKYCIKQHQLVHTKRRLFKCDECDLATKSEALLKKHQKTHYSVEPI